MIKAAQQRHRRRWHTRYDRFARKTSAATAGQMLHYPFNAFDFPVIFWMTASLTFSLIGEAPPAWFNSMKRWLRWRWIDVRLLCSLINVVRGCWCIPYNFVTRNRPTRKGGNFLKSIFQFNSQNEKEWKLVTEQTGITFPFNLNFRFDRLDSGAAFSSFTRCYWNSRDARRFIRPFFVSFFSHFH